MGVIQLGEGFGRPYSSLSVSKRAYKKDGEGAFARACSDRTGGNGFKLNRVGFGSDMQKKFFIVREVRGR